MTRTVVDTQHRSVFDLGTITSAEKLCAIEYKSLSCAHFSTIPVSLVSSSSLLPLCDHYRIIVHIIIVAAYHGGQEDNRFLSFIHSLFAHVTTSSNGHIVGGSRVHSFRDSIDCAQSQPNLSTGDMLTAGLDCSDTL